MTKIEAEQTSLFDLDDGCKKSKKKSNNNKIILTDEIVTKLEKYDLEKYVHDLESLGLETTWSYICEYVLSHGENKQFLNIKNFGEMYEIGLAVQDKQLKKDSGQYYTPDDVALIMSKWFKKCSGENVCDVACGTGKLILTYLDLIGDEKAKELISEGKLYLYDFDLVALKICKTSLAIKYSVDICDKIHDICCDFLDKKIVLPKNCKVISNPPYASISKLENNWKQTAVMNDTKEFYSCFMEKIFKQSKSTVIITPFSFISGNKFYSLRKKMCDMGNGFIIAFDNVPGNIFCGRKHGIFNTNTANSVRASITVFHNEKKEHGFRVSSLIRFKQIERFALLKNEVLESFLSDEIQMIDKNNPMFVKLDKRLENIFDKWMSLSKGKKMSDLLDNEGDLIISMPNTCRYFTTASNKEMNRNGQIILKFSNPDYFSYVYCMINSSFAYWFWRLYDGGITYPKSLLESLPVFFDSISDEDKMFFKDFSEKMIKKSDQYLVTKNNVGTQENIKFPREYRDALNERILQIIGAKDCKEIFDLVHSNMALSINV